MTGFLYLLIFLGLAAALAVTWRRRVPGGEPADHVELRLKEAWAPELLLVSPADTAFVGLCFSKGSVLLGQGREERLWPLQSLRAVEFLIDGAPTASTDASAAIPAAQGRIRAVALRISVHEEGIEPLTVRFFDWRPPGIDADRPAVRDALAKARLVFDKLAEGKAKARSRA